MCYRVSVFAHTIWGHWNAKRTQTSFSMCQICSAIGIQPIFWFLPCAYRSPPANRPYIFLKAKWKLNRWQLVNECSPGREMIQNTMRYVCQCETEMYDTRQMLIIIRAHCISLLNAAVVAQPQGECSSKLMVVSCLSPFLFFLIQFLFTAKSSSLLFRTYVVTSVEVNNWKFD